MRLWSTSRKSKESIKSTRTSITGFAQCGGAITARDMPTCRPAFHGRAAHISSTVHWYILEK